MTKVRFGLIRGRIRWVAMTMSPDDFRLFAETKEVEIETRAGGRAYRTVIWVVEGGGDLYVRSWLGDRGAWYQRVMADPKVALVVGDTRVSFEAVPASDESSVALVSEGFRKKYPRSRSTDGMVREEVLHTTMRLDPVDT